MSQLAIYAPTKGPEGYSSYARDLICNLMRQGIDVALENFDHWGPWHIPLIPERQELLKQAQQYQLVPQADPITSLNICLPQQVKLREGFRNVNATMFEVDGIPENWEACLRAVDEIIVPTDFNHWSFTHQSDIPKEKITVLPLGVEDIYNPGIEPLALINEGKSVFDYPIRMLIVCEISNRKNFWGTMQTFLTVAERLGINQCCAVLKVASYSKTVPVRQQIVEFIEQLFEQGVIHSRKFNIFLYEPLLPEQVHPNFIKIGTHYLSTSLGEGWDLTAMQAAACGLHLFVPAHTAYQCWLDQSVCTFLPILKKESASMGNPILNNLYNGSNWVYYNLPAAIDIITSALIFPEITKKKQEAMIPFISQYYWSNIIGSYIQALHL